MTVTHDEDAARYTLTRDGTLLATLDYRDDGRTIALTRAYTLPEHRGHGLAAELVEAAVDDIAARGDRRVEAVCWYVADWFEAHPERRGLLG